VTTEAKDIPQVNEQEAAEKQAEGSPTRDIAFGVPDNSEHLKAVALRAYNGHKPSQVDNDEILRLLPMVRKIARRAVSYLKPPLSFEDLVSAGTVGLLKAARDFDASHQAEFKTYAYIRIKGAVLDELRRASLLPAGVNRQIRAALELSRKIAEQTGAPPTDEELADKLGVAVEEVYALFESARARHFVSIEALDEEQPALGDLLATAQTDTPDCLLEKAELVEELAKAIQGLDERRLQIIVLYYHQHLTMKQIADVLEITESRVSQLHASALFSLSVRLEQWKDDG
jgi:RNA polymerase sigma factor for flagellar operon FliA